jgi:hypothetical protein
MIFFYSNPFAVAAIMSVSFVGVAALSQESIEGLGKPWKTLAAQLRFNMWAIHFVFPV